MSASSALDPPLLSALSRSTSTVTAKGGPVILERGELSVIHVCLSAARPTHVLHSRAPLLQVPAGDLDDQRPALIARELGIQVWTRTHDTFRRYRAAVAPLSPRAARPPPAHIPV